MDISAWKPVLVPFHPSASRVKAILPAAWTRSKVLPQLVWSLYPHPLFQSSMKADTCPETKSSSHLQLPLCFLARDSSAVQQDCRTAQGMPIGDSILFPRDVVRQWSWHCSYIQKNKMKEINKGGTVCPTNKNMCLHLLTFPTQI